MFQRLPPPHPVWIKLSVPHIKDPRTHPGMTMFGSSLSTVKGHGDCWVDSLEPRIYLYRMKAYSWNVKVSASNAKKTLVPRVTHSLLTLAASLGPSHRDRTLLAGNWTFTQWEKCISCVTKFFPGFIITPDAEEGTKSQQAGFSSARVG